MVASACGTARIVQRNDHGGTIELDGSREQAMDRANDVMAAHCGEGNFSILTEGREPVATKPGTTVWRVHYACGGSRGEQLGAPPSP